MSLDNIPLQDASYDIYKSKYQLKDNQGNPVDLNLADTQKRVAKALASVEDKNSKTWEKKFLWALEHGAIPAGRIMSNAGAEAYKPATSTINCTVSGTILDSMDGIMSMLRESALALKAGCGIGYEFSTLRPKGAFVAGAGSETSGPLTFMDVYDKMCATISSAGGRRGAQMGTFDIRHPDIIDFIKAKRENGRLRQFNLSCLVTKEFMEAVKKDKYWSLIFPASQYEIESRKYTIVYQPWVNNEQSNYYTNEKGEVACRVYHTVKARFLWDTIMESTYDYAEPGFILIDEVNNNNNNWFCEDIRTTNPCGEQPLPPYGACLLGSINLTKFVKNPFTESAYFDWATFQQVVAIFTRMLDNVVEINGLPLPQQQHEIESKRRHGMGYLGLGSTMTMLRMKYGDPESLSFTNEVSYQLARIGYQIGLELAKEKGSAPILNESFEITPRMMALRPEMENDGIKIGDKVPGKILWARYSNYFQQFAQTGNKEDMQMLNDLETYGCRFTHHSSIAPTGTISLSIANNASNGIEPSFSHYYSRNIIVEGKKTKQSIDVYSFELLAYRQLINDKAMPFSNASDEILPDYFISSDEITPKQHVDVQAAAQTWFDASISKTANVPTDFPFEDFKDIYMYAYEKNLKGCTTFRFNPENFQGVLVQKDDLANTTYEFSLEDGTKVLAQGNEIIEYDGEMHTAANLYDALKEGTYAKH